ncbi:MAG: hypothetical protein ACRC7W_07150 [Fusobacteriaceae bacterium]
MKREDFINIKKYHIKTCEEIILQGGSCLNSDCSYCPFNVRNNPHNKDCIEQRYCVADCSNYRGFTFIESAKEFVRLFKGDFENKSSDLKVCNVEIDYKNKCEVLEKENDNLKEENLTLKETVKNLSKML